MQMTRKILTATTAIVFIYIFSIVFIERNELMIGNFAVLSGALFFLVTIFFLPKEEKITIKWIDLAVILWYGYSIVHMLMYNSLNFVHNDLLVNSSLVGIYAIIRLNYLNKVNSFILFSIAVIFFGLIQGVLFIGQFFGLLADTSQNVLAVGSFAGMGSFAVFMGFVFLFAFWGMLNLTARKTFLEKFQYYFSLAFILLATFIMPLTQNRTSWIIMILGGCIITLLRYKKLVLHYFAKKWVVISVFSIIALTITGAGYYLYNIKKDSADGRVIVWKVTLGALDKNPLMGQGVDAFQQRYLYWQSDWFKTEPRQNNETLLADQVIRCYNDFLLEWLEKGFLGFIFLLSLFVTAILSLRKKMYNYALLFAVVVCVTASSLITFSYSSPYVAIVFFASLGFIANESDKILCSIPIRKKILTPTFATVSIVMLFMGWQSLKLSYYTAGKIQEILFLGKDYDEIIRNSEQELEIIKTNQTLYSSYIFALYNNGQLEKCKAEIGEFNTHYADPKMFELLGNCYKELHDLKKAENAFKMQYSMIPNRFFPLYKLLELYEETKEISKARQVAEIILRKPIKIYSPAVKDIRKKANEYLAK